MQFIYKISLNLFLLDFPLLVIRGEIQSYFSFLNENMELLKAIDMIKVK
jgi:hypothetical protein